MAFTSDSSTQPKHPNSFGAAAKLVSAAANTRTPPQVVIAASPRSRLSCPRQHGEIGAEGKAARNSGIPAPVREEVTISSGKAVSVRPN